MAKLKDRAQINRRDPDFSSVLEIKEKAQVAHSTPTEEQKPVSGPRSVNESATKAAPASAAVVGNQTSNAQNLIDDRKDLEPPAARPEIERRQGSTADRRASINNPDPARHSKIKQKGSGEKARLRFGFRFPDDLVMRAEVWALKARCPVRAILRKSFGDLRPVLINRLEKGIRYTEIPHDRIADASTSFDTSIMIDKDAYERLVKEIDPEGIMGIEAPMSRWARAQFIEHFSKYLEKHGY